MYDLSDLKNDESHLKLLISDSCVGLRGKLAWAIGHHKLQVLKRRLRLLLIAAIAVLLIVLGIDSPETLDLIRTLLSAVLSQMGG